MNKRLLFYTIVGKIKHEFYMMLRKITKRKMIIDVTGTVLTPGNGGKDCYGNGKHFNRRRKLIQCCCDACDYMICCLEEHSADECKNCTDKKCPRAKI